MKQTLDELWQFAIAGLPQLVIPIAILLSGFVGALILSGVVRRGLHATKLDERLATTMLGPERGTSLNTERWAGRIVFWLVMLLALVAVLQASHLMAVAEPVNAMLAPILAFVPSLIGAAGIAFAAWLVASLCRSVLSRALIRWDVDRKLRRELGGERAESPPVSPSEISTTDPSDRTAVSRPVAEAGYWLVWLLFTPALLAALKLEGLLVPVREMVQKSLAFAPNVAAALIVFVVGWFVARIVQRIVTNSLAGIGVDRLSEKSGVKGMLGELTLSGLAGFVVYFLILVPVAIGGLNALQLDAITGPASGMLQQFFAAVPSIFGAALVVAVSYIAARLLYGFVHTLLNGIGFDNVLSRIGMTQEQLGKRTPSKLVAGLTMVAVIYFATMEAARLLGFSEFAGLAAEFSVVAGHVLLGLVLFGVGLFLSKLAADAVTSSNIAQSRVLGMATRVSILTLTGAMGLRQMGIADEIIVLAFGLVLGAVAIAGALAFGLGGRDAASKTIEEIRVRLHDAATGPTGDGNGGSDRPASRREEPVIAAPGQGVPIGNPVTASESTMPAAPPR